MGERDYLRNDKDDWQQLLDTNGKRPDEIMDNIYNTSKDSDTDKNC